MTRETLHLSPTEPRLLNPAKTPRSGRRISFGKAAAAVMASVLVFASLVSAQVVYSQAAFGSERSVFAVERQELQGSPSQFVSLPTVSLTASEQAMLQPLVEERYSTFTLVPGNLEVVEFQVAQDESGRFVFPDQGLTLEPGSPLDQMVQYQAQRVQERFGNNFTIHLVSVTPSEGILQGATFKSAVAAELMEEQQLDNGTIPAGTVVRFDEATGDFSYFAPNDSTQVGYGLMTLQDLLDLQDALAEQGIEMSLPQSIDPLEEYIFPVGLRLEDNTLGFLYTESVAIEFQRPILSYDGTTPLNIRSYPFISEGSRLLEQLQPGDSYVRASADQFLAFIQSDTGRNIRENLDLILGITPEGEESVDEAIARYFRNGEYNDGQYRWIPIVLQDGTIGWVAELSGVLVDGGLPLDSIVPTATPEPAENTTIEETENRSSREPVMIDPSNATVTAVSRITGIPNEQILPRELSITVPETFTYNGQEYPMGILGRVQILTPPADNSQLREFVVFSAVVEVAMNYRYNNGLVSLVVVAIPSQEDPQIVTRMIFGAGSTDELQRSQRVNLNNNFFEALTNSDETLRLRDFATIQTQTGGDFAQQLSQLQQGDTVILFSQTNRGLERAGVWEDIQNGTLEPRNEFIPQMYAEINDPNTADWEIRPSIIIPINQN